MTSKFLFAVFASFFLISLSNAEILNVPDEFETIQAAINESEYGDTVLVQPGEYEENINFEGQVLTVASLILTTGNEVYIDSTVINGRRRGSVVRFDHAENRHSILTGFSLTNGSGSEDLDRDMAGGGIHCLRASPTLSHLKIHNNSAHYGGGIFLQHSSPLIELVNVSGNSSVSNGGGIYCSRENTEPIIQSCKVFDNETAGYGGGIAIRGASPRIDNCEITGNSADRNGGGIYCSQENTEPLFTRTLICNNRAYVDGGGIGCFNGVNPIFENTTITSNLAEYGSALYSITRESPSYISFKNSIIWGNGEVPILIGPGSDLADTLIFSYTDLEDGRDEISRRNSVFIGWGEGNIDEDPRFVNVDQNDFRLAIPSPCINSGDPDSPNDPDGSRADMGALAFEGGVLFGHVFDFSDSSAIAGAQVSHSFGMNTNTDEEGYWELSVHTSDNFNLTAGNPGYIDSVITELEIVAGDTLEFEFYLKHSEMTISTDSVSAELDQGDSSEEFNFFIDNPGNGALEWNVRKKLRGEFGVDPGELRVSFNASEEVEEEELFSVVYHNGNYYVAGTSDESNKIYQFNSEFEYLPDNDVDLPIELFFTDMAWDGELVWCVTTDSVYAFNQDWDVVSIIPTPRRSTRTIAYDTENDWIWVSSRTSEIVAYNRAGDEVDELDRDGHVLYGLAYWADDPDDCPLYVFTKDPTDDVRIEFPTLYKINPEVGEFVFVAQLADDWDHRMTSAFICESYDPYTATFMNISDNGEGNTGEQVNIWQLHAKTHWMIVDPTEGILNPGNRQDFSLILDAHGLEQVLYPGELIFSNNAIGGEITIPIDLSIVDPNSIETSDPVIPEAFEISSVFPNPFNSSTTLNYSIPSTSRITLSIFDIQGREVRTLVDNKHFAGSYSILFDASMLPTGVYLARLKAGGDFQTVKIVSLK